MKPLSERYDAITGQHIINGEIVRKNVTPEVAQLEAEIKTKGGALNTCAIRLGRVKAENEALRELVKTEFDFTEEETNDYLKHALLLSHIPDSGATNGGQ